jgi:hypothetical protein
MQYDQNTPLLYGISPVTMPKPSEWPTSTYLCGYWTLDSAAAVQDFKPSVELSTFLENRQSCAMVFVGFGSMFANTKRVKKLMRQIVPAASLNGFCLILDTSLGSLVDASEKNEAVFILDGPLPHPWLFDRIDLAIHHGICFSNHPLVYTQAALGLQRQFGRRVCHL